MKPVVALFAVAFAAGIARHLYKVAVGRKPSTLQRLADDAERTTHVVISVSPRVKEQL